MTVVCAAGWAAGRGPWAGQAGWWRHMSRMPWSAAWTLSGTSEYQGLSAVPLFVCGGQKMGTGTVHSVEEKRKIWKQAVLRIRVIFVPTLLWLLKVVQS